MQRAMKLKHEKIALQLCDEIVHCIHSNCVAPKTVTKTEKNIFLFYGESLANN